MNRVLEGVKAELELLGQIRAYCDRREVVLRDLEQRAGQLEPLNFDPAEGQADLAVPPALPAAAGGDGAAPAVGTSTPAPRRRQRRAQRVAPPGLPPPSRTQDRSVQPRHLDSARVAQRVRGQAASRDAVLAGARADDEAVLAKLHQIEPAAQRELAQALGWPGERASRVLQRLREACKAQPVGTGRWAKWYLTSTLDRLDTEQPGSVDDMSRGEAERAAVHRRLACREDLLRTFRVEPGAWTEERICATKAWAAEDVEAVCAALLEEGVAQRNYDGTYSLDDVWLATSEAA